MGTFITLVIIGAIIVLIAKSSKKNKQPKNIIKEQSPITVEIKTSYSSGSSSYREEKFPPIKQDANQDWILNPKSPFIITLQNAEKQIAEKLRAILDDDESRGYKKEQEIIGLFALHNLRIKEIESYKSKYAKQYFEKIEELKKASKDWGISGIKDKEDILVDFRKEAINELYERANCDLEVLFEYEPKDITIDDELIKEYGFENIQTYLSYADKLDKVRVMSADAYARPMFEKLSESGLAKRGNEIPNDEILLTLTLKELNEIADNPEKQYYRKKQAVEFILEKGNAEELIGKKISLRELFKLNPLPEKYNSINLNELSQTWRYHEEEVKLLTQTFRNSYYSWRDLKEDKEYIKGYTVEPLHNEDACPKAVECSKKKYSKNSPPKVPFHIGCDCYLNKDLDF